MKRLAVFVPKLTNRARIAVALIGVFFLGWGISCNLRSEVRPVAQQLVRLVEIIHQNFQTKPDFWKLNSAWLIDNELIPQEMLSGRQIINALGKPVEIGSGIEGRMLMPGARSFDIVYKDLTQSECAALASYAYPQAQTLGLISLTIINGKEERNLVWGEENGLPLSADKAREICQKKNILIWNFE